ncbi:hypothetical protein GCM10009000_106070 [Halobacterium noricense]
MLLADGFEEFDAVLPRHVEVRNDAVDVFVGENRVRVAGIRGGHDLDAVVLAFDELARHLREPGPVVDVEHADGVSHYPA